MKKKILALCLVVVLAVTAVTGATLAYFTDTTKVVENTFTMGKVKLDLDEAKVVDGVATAERVKANGYTDAMVPGHVFPKDPTIHVKAGSEESYIFLDVTINKFNSLAWVMAANEGVAEKFIPEGGVFSSTNYLKSLVADKATRIAVIEKWIPDIEHADWTIADIFVNGDELTIRLAYNTTVDAKAAQVDIVFMESFQMPATVTQEMIENGIKVGKMQSNFNTDAAKFKMSFVAYAIQADEMEVVDENGYVTKDGLHGAYEALFGADMGANMAALGA